VLVITMHVPALAALGLCLASCPSSARGADEKAAENAKTRLAASQKVYTDTFQRWQIDVGPPRDWEKRYQQDWERMYQWSRRWLEAAREVTDTKEGRIAAIGAHLDRMKKLEDLGQHWLRKGYVSKVEVAAVEFFRLEAEHWLTEGKANEKAAENARARLAASQKAYNGTFQRWNVDFTAPNPVEGLYQWSRRWLEADRDLADTKEGRAAALQAHLDRMKKLEDQVRQWHKGKFTGPLEVTAAELFRLEAEHWLARDKGA
jgi:hypothetical protein